MVIYHLLKSKQGLYTELPVYLVNTNTIKFNSPAINLTILCSQSSTVESACRFNSLDIFVATVNGVGIDVVLGCIILQ